MAVVVVRHGGHVLGEADMTGLDWAQTLTNSPHLRWWWDSLAGLACTPKNLARPRRLESWALEGAADIHRQAGFAACGKLLHHLSPS